MNNKQANNQVNGNNAMIQSVPEGFLGMTPVIKAVLMLPGEKVNK